MDKESLLSELKNSQEHGKNVTLLLVDGETFVGHVICVDDHEVIIENEKLECYLFKIDEITQIRLAQMHI